ncbi:MAG: hypothetical protein WCG79_08295 [Verrucomicrobiota bacterium]
MGRKRHKRDTQEFGEETFADQARTITATINNLQRAIQRHIAGSTNPLRTSAKCLNQLQRLISRL